MQGTYTLIIERETPDSSSQESMTRDKHTEILDEIKKISAEAVLWGFTVSLKEYRVVPDMNVLYILHIC